MDINKKILFPICDKFDLSIYIKSNHEINVTFFKDMVPYTPYIDISKRQHFLVNLKTRIPKMFFFFLYH